MHVGLAAMYWTPMAFVIVYCVLFRVPDNFFAYMTSTKVIGLLDPIMKNISKALELFEITA